MNRCGNESCERYTKTKYCSSSCAASVNNRGRQRNKEWIAAQNFPENQSRPHTPYLRGLPDARNGRGKLMTFIKFLDCSVCSKPFVSQRTGHYYAKSCSEECRQSIRRKNATGIKEHVYNGVKMDSRWEVSFAEFLDSMKIEWVRPKEPLLWVDSTGKTRRYYPDFYVPSMDIFFDPKNPIVAIKQREKLDAIATIYHNVMVGDLDILKSFVLAGAVGGSRTHMCPVNLPTAS